VSPGIAIDPGRTGAQRVVCLPPEAPVRIARVILVFAALPTASVAAQGRPKVDLGIHAGATILIPSAGGAEYVIGIPGGGSLGGQFPALYATFFAGGNLMVEPQVAFIYQSFNHGGLFNIALQLGYLTRATAQGSPYLAWHLLAANAFGSGGFSSSYAAGASVGYRHVVRQVLGLRYEARFRRWFEADLNEVGLLVGFGVAIH
jgi:hypothetical protein